MPLSQLLSPFAALGVVLLVAFGIGRVLRCRVPTFGTGGSPRSRPLAIQAALSLDPKRRLLLVSCEDRRAVLVTGPTGDTFLGWLDGPISGLAVDASR